MSEIAKKLFLIFSGPMIGCGNTTLSLNLAETLVNCAYFNKSVLDDLSRVVLDAADKSYDCQAAFFKNHIHEIEYNVLQDLCLMALRFNSRVLVDAPYFGSIHTEAAGARDSRLEDLYDRIHKQGGELMIIYTDVSKETIKARLLKRREKDPAFARLSPAIYDHLDAFVETQLQAAPKEGSIAHCDHYFLFDGDHPDTSFAALKAYMGVASDAEYDANITSRYPTRGI